MSHVSTKHLVLGLVDNALEDRKEPGIAAQVLSNLDIDLVALRNQALSWDDKDLATKYVPFINVSDVQIRQLKDTGACRFVMTADGNKFEVTMPNAVARKFFDEMRTIMDTSASAEDLEA
jgi:hypothetical protein